jgi:hypothetical protein
MQTIELQKVGSDMNSLDSKVDRLDEKVDGLGQRVGRVENAVDELNGEMRTEFRAVRGELGTLQATMLRGFIAMFATMLAGFAAVFSQL